MQRSRISSSVIWRARDARLASMKSLMIFSTSGSGLGVRLPFVVVVVAGAGLLAAAVHLAEHFARPRRRHAASPCGCASRCRGRPGRSSRTGPSGSRSRRARGRCPSGIAPSRISFSASRRRWAACGCRRSRGTRPTSTGDLADLAGRAPSRWRSRPCAVFSPRTISSSRMTLAGEKKCRPITSSGRVVAERDLVDVQVRGVGGQDRARLGDARRACANTSFLIVHLLEHGLDDHVGVGERVPGRCEPVIRPMRFSTSRGGEPAALRRASRSSCG